MSYRRGGGVGVEKRVVKALAQTPRQVGATPRLETPRVGVAWAPRPLYGRAEGTPRAGRGHAQASLGRGRKGARRMGTRIFPRSMGPSGSRGQTRLCAVSALGSVGAGRYRRPVWARGARICRLHGAFRAQARGSAWARYRLACGHGSSYTVSVSASPASVVVVERARRTSPKRGDNMFKDMVIGGSAEARALANGSVDMLARLLRATRPRVYRGDTICGRSAWVIARRLRSIRKEQK